MKLKCQNCGNEFEGRIALDELGWHGYCHECDSSFDVDVPKGRIVMAFTDPHDDEEDPYTPFTDDFTGEDVNIYFAFDTPEEFIQKWTKIVNEEEGPYGMWYWVLDNNELICSGACDPDDIDGFIEHFGIKILEDTNQVKNYRIVYKETLIHTFDVEASSKEEARAVFEEKIAYGELDFSDGEIDTTEIIIKEEK